MADIRGSMALDANVFIAAIKDDELSSEVRDGVFEVRSVGEQTLVKAMLDPLALGEAETIALAVEL